MSLAIVQHQLSLQKAADGSGNTAPDAWGSSPTAGNLLLAEIVFNSSTLKTVTCTAGWSQAASIQSGSQQTELWYKPNASGGDASPTFNIGGTFAYRVGLQEVSGVQTSTPLDRTGTNSGTSPVTTAVSSTITDTGELVINVSGGYDSSAKNNRTWTRPSSAGGSATFQADIDFFNPNKGGGVGIIISWAISGGSGTSPSITTTTDSSTNLTQRACIATFKAVAASTSIKAVDKVDYANISKVDGVAIGSIKKVDGLA